VLDELITGAIGYGVLRKKPEERSNANIMSVMFQGCTMKDGKVSPEIKRIAPTKAWLF